MSDHISTTKLDKGQVVDPVECRFEREKATLVASYVNLGRVARDNDTRTESDTRQEHFHLLRRRVLRLVENDEAVVQGPATHEGERRDFDHLLLDQTLHTLHVEHVVEGVVERPKVRVDLCHQIARQESESFASLDCWAGQNDALNLFCLKCSNRHRHCQPRFARTRRTDTKRDDVLRDGVDISLLTGGFRLDLTSFGVAEYLVRQNFAGALIGPHHRENPVERVVVELLTVLDQCDELLEQPRHVRDLSCLLPRYPDFVTSDTDGNGGKFLLDASQKLIPWPDERRHHVFARHDNRDVGI